ncbi:MAG: 5'-methylthioadenosine/S-adenosylhomocysteine nucleosidase [Anaerolineae bacterium]|nr:5'-methylthioadenosine/S-adenosylhomocysteine nucleosidase [Anaerolineae bacterium]
MPHFIPKTVAVIFSASTEWRIAREYLNPTEVFPSPFGDWCRITNNEQTLIFIQGGWGKISAAASTQYIIDHWQPDLVVNLGTCGGFAGSGLIKDDIILATETLVYDIVEQMGAPQEATAFYTTPLDLSWLPQPLPMHVKMCRLVSADRDILPNDIPELKEKYQAIAADWESGAIAWVAKRNHKPCLILRGVSDLVNTQTGEAYGNFDLFIESCRRIIPLLIKNLPLWLVGFNTQL